MRFISKYEADINESIKMANRISHTSNMPQVLVHYVFDWKMEIAWPWNLPLQAIKHQQ